VRNHTDKVRDITRSVLPSTARRSASKNRKLIHRAERHAVAAALRRGDDPVVVRSYRGDVTEMVWERRSADKVAPLVRWALYQVRTDPDLRNSPLQVQVDYFRRILPDTTIGRHALSHIAWPLGRQHPNPTPARWYRYYSPRPEGTSIEPLVRRLYEAGYHAELNKRLKIHQLPLLAGQADIVTFASNASTDTRRLVAQCADDVLGTS
jgi:hypothetical protein